MRCEPILSGCKLTQTMWLKTLTAISLLTLSNVAQHFNLIELGFPYHALANLVINNLVCLFCSHWEVHFLLDFIWKLATALSLLNDSCFQVKVALDTVMIVKQVVETFQMTKIIKRFHKQDSPAHPEVTTYLEPRPSIHKTRANHTEAKLELFLAHKITSLNLGKSTGVIRRNVKKPSESESLSGLEFPKVNINASAGSLKNDLPNTWGFASQWSSKSSDKSTPSSPTSSLLKPSRLSFSPNESPTSRQFSPSERIFPARESRFSPSDSGFSPSERGFSPSESVFSPSERAFSPSERGFSPSESRFSPSERRCSPSERAYSSTERLRGTSHALSLPRHSPPPPASLSQTLFYSSTPRVVYVQVPSPAAEQSHLKLVCYLFSLVIVYIVYNEVRLARMYQPVQPM